MSSWLGEWPSSSRTFKAAVYLFWAVLACVTFAFATPYWLVSVPDEELPNPKFTNLGLWTVCLNGFNDMRLQYERAFYGCGHVLLEDYDIIRNEIQPPFMVATQFFFTLCLCGLLIAALLILMYLFCINDYYKIHVLRATGIDLIVSALAGVIAVVVFGVHGDKRDFMPDWEHNYHSWSFGLACVGVILQVADGIVFLVEARVVLRWRRAGEKQFPQGERTTA